MAAPPPGGSVDRIVEPRFSLLNGYVVDNELFDRPRLLLSVLSVPSVLSFRPDRESESFESELFESDVLEFALEELELLTWSAVGDDLEQVVRHGCRVLLQLLVDLDVAVERDLLRDPLVRAAADRVGLLLLVHARLQEGALGVAP